METQVTIIFDDNAVYVNKEMLEVNLAEQRAPEDGIHAIQWLDRQGTIEYTNSVISGKVITGTADYNKYVAPYVVLWQRAKAKTDAALKKIQDFNDTVGINPTCGCGHAHSPEEEFNLIINKYLERFVIQHGWESVAIALCQTGAFKVDAEQVQEAYDKVWAVVFDEALEDKYKHGLLTAAEVLAQLPVLEWA